MSLSSRVLSAFAFTLEVTGGWVNYLHLTPRWPEGTFPALIPGPPACGPGERETEVSAELWDEVLFLLGAPPPFRPPLLLPGASPSPFSLLSSKGPSFAPVTCFLSPIVLQLTSTISVTVLDA